MFASGNPGVEFFLFWLNSVGAGDLLLIPARAVLLFTGIWWTFRARSGRVLLPIFLTFYLLSMAFMYVDLPIVKQVFALTFPWGFRDRLGHMQNVAANLMCGVGLLAIAANLPRLRSKWPTLLGEQHPAAWRRTVIASVVLALFLAEGSAIAVFKTLAIANHAVGTYSVDDAAAMAWLRQHSRPGDVLANDWAADAGVWAPYKAGIPALAGPRKYTTVNQREELIVLDRLASIDEDARVLEVMCARGARYVVRGAAATVYEPRSFPPLDMLRRAASLEEVFQSGEAAVFQIRDGCRDRRSRPS
jgi:hypothetical protein